MGILEINQTHHQYLQPTSVDYTTEWLAKNNSSKPFEIGQESYADSWVIDHDTFEQLPHTGSGPSSETIKVSPTEELTPPSDSSFDSQSETSVQSSWQSTITSYSTDGSSEEGDYDSLQPLSRTNSNEDAAHDNSNRHFDACKDVSVVSSTAQDTSAAVSPGGHFKLPSAQRDLTENSQGLGQCSQPPQRSYDQAPEKAQCPEVQRYNRRRSGPSEGAPAPPCKLRRDTDSSECFVSLLIVFATRLITAIWPLSACPPMMSTCFNNGAGVLPLRVFIQETLRRSKTSYSTLQVALYYLILLKDKLPDCDFTREQSGPCSSEDDHPVNKPPHRAMQCGRRMFLAALMLASKYLQDRNYSTRAWSKISGLRSVEINENEMQYLSSIDYNLHMTKESFENWSRLVLTICKVSRTHSKHSRESALYRKISADAKNGHLANLLSDAMPEGPITYSDQWWTNLLTKIQPDVIKDTAETDDFLVSNIPGFEVIDVLTKLDQSMSNSPASSRSIQTHKPDMIFSDAFPSRATSMKTPSTQPCRSTASPTSTNTLPLRPQLRNLPTPQSTPQVAQVSPMPNSSGSSVLRCSASMDALRSIRKQCFTNANLERCPPPRPSSFFLPSVQNLVRPAASTLDNSSRSTTPSVLSPVSFMSEPICVKSRSRSSSISSSSSWSSLASERKKLVQITQDLQFSSPSTSVCSVSRFKSEEQNRQDHVTGELLTPSSMDLSNATYPSSISGSKRYDRTTNFDTSSSGKYYGTKNEADAIQALMSLSSSVESADSHVKWLSKNSTGNVQSRRHASSNISPSAGHKRSYSRTNEVMHSNIRDSLLADSSTDVAMEDSILSSHEKGRAKQMQVPSKQWASPKKPMPNCADSKRVAMYCSLYELNSAPDLASQFVKEHMVTV